MDSKEDNMSKELKLIEEDFQNEWWKPASVDEFDMTKKLLRVGCRPLKRKYLNCLKTSNMDSSTFSACSVSHFQISLIFIDAEE